MPQKRTYKKALAGTPGNEYKANKDNSKARARRNKANRAAKRKGVIKKGDGNHMHHPAGNAKGPAVKTSAKRNLKMQPKRKK